MPGRPYSEIIQDIETVRTNHAAAARALAANPHDGAARNRLSAAESILPTLERSQAAHPDHAAAQSAAAQQSVIVAASVQIAGMKSDVNTRLHEAAAAAINAGDTERARQIVALMGDDQ